MINRFASASTSLGMTCVVGLKKGNDVAGGKAASHIISIPLNYIYVMPSEVEAPIS